MDYDLEIELYKKTFKHNLSKSHALLVTIFFSSDYAT
jgi:hypothetical protein